MRIPTKGHYTFHLTLSVALHSHGAVVPLRDAAQWQEIPDGYLEQIVTQLSRAGLVRSVRGAGGGHLLTREPGEYTVGEILQMLEGNLAPVSCMDQDGTCCCNRADRCVTVEMWRDIQAAVSDVADRLTLVDLVRRYHEKCPGHNVWNSPKQIRAAVLIFNAAALVVQITPLRCWQQYEHHYSPSAYHTG